MFLWKNENSLLISDYYIIFMLYTVDISQFFIYSFIYLSHSLSVLFANIFFQDEARSPSFCACRRLCCFLPGNPRFSGFPQVPGYLGDNQDYPDFNTQWEHFGIVGQTSQWYVKLQNPEIFYNYRFIFQDSTSTSTCSPAHALSPLSPSLEPTLWTWERPTPPLLMESKPLDLNRRWPSSLELTVNPFRSPSEESPDPSSLSPPSRRPLTPRSSRPREPLWSVSWRLSTNLSLQSRPLELRLTTTLMSSGESKHSEHELSCCFSVTITGLVGITDEAQKEEALADIKAAVDALTTAINNAYGGQAVVELLTFEAETGNESGEAREIPTHNIQKRELTDYEKHLKAQRKSFQCTVPVSQDYPAIFAIFLGLVVILVVVSFNFDV